ncbi:hypothetical protein B9Z65_4582 [Elsinoe australis]|uniref:Uncharacterized protein n=1 Tax=Elsinoe australis TaxID=40998 RepID=A0A2P8A5F9_9PEZI|nr:hypothetical protein B9Z65_4582 [Elsinoe australis]
MLFAEHLPFVQSTNLIIQLGSVLDSNTRLSIGDSGRSILLQHHGQEERIRLHAAVANIKHDSQLLPAPPLTSRISRLAALTRHKRSASGAEQQAILWTANQLDKDAQFLCGGRTSSGDFCHAVILGNTSIKAYKDLPSEGWADMMDLWHCHKPEEDHDHSALNEKGYSASSRLIAQTGVAMVDILTFLVSKEDCTNIKILEHEQNRIVCDRCGCLIGEVDTLCSGIRLYKPLLAFKSAQSEAITRHDTRLWLSSYLLSLIDTSGIRKFQGRYSDFTIWIFSPLVFYSLSTLGEDPKPALKIFYKKQLIEDRDQTMQLNKQNMQLDELTLPRDLEAALADALGMANTILPSEARKFQDWNVAFLDRFPPEGG